MKQLCHKLAEADDLVIVAPQSDGRPDGTALRDALWNLALLLNVPGQEHGGWLEYQAQRQLPRRPRHGAPARRPAGPRRRHGRRGAAGLRRGLGHDAAGGAWPRPRRAAGRSRQSRRDGDHRLRPGLR
ncbi:MAG: hypothetical protein M5U09_18050 [Gammaproteobacteria bacterium]|nr:hypothetical protein [Gammaproteobacteria bacterium]